MAGTQEINIFRNQANLGSEASHCTAASGPISGLSVLGCKMGTPADELTLLLKTKAPPSVLGVWLVTFAFRLVSHWRAGHLQKKAGGSTEMRGSGCPGASMQAGPPGRVLGRTCVMSQPRRCRGRTIASLYLPRSLPGSVRFRRGDQDLGLHRATGLCSDRSSVTHKLSDPWQVV